MTAKRNINLIVYAPSLVSADHRPLAVVHGMERAFPGLRLEWKVSDDGRPIALPQRDAWLAAGTKDGGFPLVCNGNENLPVMISGWESPADSSPGGQSQLEVHAQLPPNEGGLAAVVDVLEAVAESARAHWGHATPFRASADIARQTRNRPDDLEVPPRGLPVITSPGAMKSPEIPHRLGWMNYWSAAAAQAIGFPDPARDTELLSRARHTSSGGWVVQLTDTPLDLDDPAHLEALKRTYERFPEIGGRAAS
ncbi:hypothetical protein HJC22_06310 [Corallococcus exiguus]|uniref:DUF5953 family protein n=1 Tax=Corallococcus TaxID=83461 RepID=UPI000EE1885B|nr:MULTISPECIES: DUF5953 family protein [Corallococcus]NNC15343.1 hypothetical protein [Corallococcus exiguus]NRD56565.1 hypothetical protein [Corallococcus exiguus]RKH94489.1 hypothetical protein D7Y15_42675 [Corallococcus sp. AB030]RUO93124.1 hypothetical protein D7Y11_11230 [Corallococcus sp. AB018]